jgi:hypothetical protein
VIVDDAVFITYFPKVVYYLFGRFIGSEILRRYDDLWIAFHFAFKMVDPFRIHIGFRSGIVIDTEKERLRLYPAE